MDPDAARFVRFRDAGDVQALDAVFEAAAPGLLSLALHLCGEPADAEDVVQETFLLAMERAAGFDPGRPLLPWLTGLLHNVARNQRRRAATRRARALPELPSDKEIDPQSEAEREELIAMLRTRAAALPADQRRVVLLRLLHGLAPAEIAEVLGEPPGRVRMRLMRGLARLRASLPAGLSLLMLGVTTTRGLAAVRRTVARHAAAHAAAVAPAVGWLGAGGVILMKKTVCACLLLAGAFAWFWSGSGEPLPAVAEAGGAPSCAGALAAGDGPAGPAADAAVEAAGRTPAAPRPGALHVTLRSTDRAGGGRPFAGAPIRLWPGAVPVAPFDDSLRELVTDARGEVRFPDLAPGVWHVLDPADMNAVARRLSIESGAEARVVLTRDTVGTLRGRVVDPQGRPVAGAEVWLSCPSGRMGRDDLPRPPEHCHRRAATTGPEGGFEVALALGEILVSAAHPAWVASRAQVAHALGRHGLTLTLGAAPATLGGTVFAPDGSPAVGVRVRVLPPGQDPRRAADGTALHGRRELQVETDRRGRFECGGLPGGGHRLTITQPGHAFALHEVEVPVGGRAETEIRLQPGGTHITGFVRTPDGAPFGARVRCKPSKDVDGHYSDHSTRLDGSYFLSYAPARTFVVVVEHGGGVLASREFADVEPGRIRCDFVIEGFAYIRGTLRTDRGRPLPGWRVRARGHAGVVTDDGGAFRVLARSDRVHTLDVAPPGDPGHPVLERAGVRCGAAVDLRVPEAGIPRASLHGRVVDGAGAAVAGIEVRMARAEGGGRPRIQESADGGGFRFSGVGPGAYEVRAAVPGGARVELTVSGAGEHDVGALAVPAPARLEVAVTDAGGRPWRGTLPQVEVRDAAGQRVGCRVGHRAGGLVLSVPIAGDGPATFSVRPVGVDLVAQPQEVVLARGERARVRFAVGIAHTRQLAFNHDGEVKFRGRRRLHVEVRDAARRIVCAEDVVARARHLRGYDFWSLTHTFAPGRYSVRGTAADGTLYRGDFVVTADPDEPTLVRVARAR